MKWGEAFVVICCLVVGLTLSEANDGPYLADNSYIYKLNLSNGTRCMTFSLEANIAVSYKYMNTSNVTHPVSVMEEEFTLPNNTATSVSSYCSARSRRLGLSWMVNDREFNITFNFKVDDDDKAQWYMAQVLFDFELDDSNFLSPEVSGPRSYRTSDNSTLFNRTFGLDQYFHCKSCKKLWLVCNENDSTQYGPCFKKDNKTTVCSFMELSNSVIYIGNLDNNTLAKKKLCLEDFIELQEIIIPSVVGGVLGLLLFIIFSAYIIAFLRRKSREGRYETLNEGY